MRASHAADVFKTFIQHWLIANVSMRYLLSMYLLRSILTRSDQLSWDQLATRYELEQNQLATRSTQLYVFVPGKCETVPVFMELCFCACQRRCMGCYSSWPYQLCRVAAFIYILLYKLNWKYSSIVSACQFFKSSKTLFKYFNQAMDRFRLAWLR